ETTPRRDLDDEYVATYLARGYLTTARTPFVSIQRLLPGMSLTWSKDAYRCFRAWDLAKVAPVRLRNDSEYEEQFRSLLEAALRATVNPAGTNWVSLSGGLDSSSVLSVAGKLGLSNIGAYSFISPGSPQGDEQHWARAVIDRYPVPWYTVDAAEALPFAELPDSFEFQGEPTSAVLYVKTHRLLDALFMQHNVKTVLTGHGGDAVLGASPGTIPAYLVDHLFAGHPLKALLATRDWSANHYNKRSVSFLLRHAVLGPAVAHLHGYQFEPDHGLPLPPWMEEQYAEKWQIFRLSRRQVATRDRYPGRQAIWDSVWAHALSAGSARSHVGYDIRKPLLYRPFFEFMYAVPGEQRVQPRCDRHLQRRALKGILPELVRRRGTKLFGTWAFVEGLAQSPGWLDYLCENPRMPQLGITTGPKWRDAIKQASVGNTFGDRFFIAGVTLEVWLKQMAAWHPHQPSSILRSTRAPATSEAHGALGNARNHP
ncbi:MAG: asparagine synthase C-terminal domain-containing protein, partial [Bryobacteraceae bacterium]